MTKIKSAIIIDYSEMDTLISGKILKKYGVSNILAFKSTYKALFYLKETTVNYEFILIEVNVPLFRICANTRVPLDFECRVLSEANPAENVYIGITKWTQKLKPLNTILVNVN
jgi:hypothetical protein